VWCVHQVSEVIGSDVHLVRAFSLSFSFCSLSEGENIILYRMGFMARNGSFWV
jgi:hypothetical protein